MASIFMLPTRERLFVERSEEVPGGLKLGVELAPAAKVSVHLSRAEASKLADAIDELCPRRGETFRDGGGI